MQATIAAVAQVLVAFPVTDAGVAGTARAEAFAMALDDLPAWAVAAACRQWLRGEGGIGGENYAFAPSPPQLRRLAERHARCALGRAITLERLADAIAEPEFSDEHRREMQRRIGSLRLSIDTDTAA